jgi:hypothetical protein
LPIEPDPEPEPDAEWEERQRYWRRRLGRLRIGPEPIADQLARYRRVTLMLTAIPAALAVFFVSLFAAFRRPDVGVVLALVLFVPVVAVAWLDFTRLRLRAERYEQERRDHEQSRHNA